MQKVLYIKDTHEIQKIYSETYPYLMAALKARNPKAKILNEDYELSQLHNMFPFIRLGNVRVNDSYDGVIFLEYFENSPKEPFKPLPFQGFNT